MPGHHAADDQPGGPLHVAGEVGHRQAALAAALPAAGLHDHRVGQHQRRRGRCCAFGWPVTSSENTRSGTPTCGAASPTQPGAARWVASRSAARATTSGSSGSTSADRRGQHRRRRAARRPQPTPGRQRREVHRERHSTSGSRTRSDTSTPSSAPTAARSRLSCSGSTVPGQVDLGEQHVELAGEPGRQVGDVAAGLGAPARSRRDDAGPVGAVHRAAGTSMPSAAAGSSRGSSRTETTSEPSAVSVRERGLGLGRRAPRPWRPRPSRSGRAGWSSSSPRGSHRARRGRRSSRR